MTDWYQKAFMFKVKMMQSFSLALEFHYSSSVQILKKFELKSSRVFSEFHSSTRILLVLELLEYTEKTRAQRVLGLSFQVQLFQVLL